MYVYIYFHPCFIYILVILYLFLGIYVCKCVYMCVLFNVLSLICVYNPSSPL